MSKEGCTPENPRERTDSDDSKIIVADDGGEILTDGGETDDDQDEESRRLDNPAWKDRLRADGGVELDEPYTLTTLKCRVRGRMMFRGDDDGAQ